MRVEMTPRERWLAAFDLRPVDRLPFWPKLNGSYPRAQSPPFDGMSIDEIHGWIGSDRHVHVRSVFRETGDGAERDQTRGDNVKRTTFRVAGRTLTAEERFDEASQAWHPVEMPVKTREDIGLMAEFYRRRRAEPSPEGVRAAEEKKRELGEGGVTATGIGTSALMHWVEHLAGIQNAHLFLADHPDEVEELFDAMQRLLVRKAEIAAELSPADLIYLTENTSTTLISPDQYRGYCVPQVGAVARIARDAGRRLVLHMCGHLKAILPDLAGMPAAAFEAFTSPTLGNTTLLDGRAACPEVCLVGGTNAVLWTRPAGEITAELGAHLDELPHHRGIVVTSAGVMPPLCPPETIREVLGWVREYPVRN